MFGKKKGSTNLVHTEAGSAAAVDPVSAGGEISAEIVAVIAAAIAAMAGESAGANGLIIRKISRIHGEKISWSNAGLMECIDSRKF